MNLPCPKKHAWKTAVFAMAAVAALAPGLLFTPGQAKSQIRAKNVDARTNAAFSGKDFRAWMAEFRNEAHATGISEKTLDAALLDIVPVKRVIELDRSQPEFTQTFREYLGRRVTEERVQRGKRLLKKHRDLLKGIYTEYGVPPRYLIAFWGLETNFGDHQGGFRVIDALVTLAFDQRRSEFFRTQLLHALKIIEQGHITPDQMTGSWAGAMGHMQFLPSTFTGHAVDYSGNGRKDIWASLPDAFASAANFLSNRGWQPGETWGRRVSLPEEFDIRLATMNRKKPVNEWSRLGVRQADGTALPQADMKGSVILPQGREGPAFLVYQNFRVIMRWNRSVNYAISVGLLADRIAGMPAAGSFRKK
ncbi:MAG: lytic murein transglycosylase [Desulfobacteraceae bacterium]|nr:lytic murein transglycosylase [Desulfobacteraceae bacterium]